MGKSTTDKPDYLNSILRTQGWEERTNFCNLSSGLLGFSFLPGNCLMEYAKVTSGPSRERHRVQS